MTVVSSPGKIILFGEHAVVYDKLGIACTIDKKCFVRVSSFQKNSVFVVSRELGLKKCLSKKEIFGILKTINNLKKRADFNKIKEFWEKDRLVPVFFVLANIFRKYGFSALKIEINSKIPKNLGSSSAVFSALSLAVLSFLKISPSKKEISDLAFLGDLIVHGGTPSGIDNSTVTFGGYLKYRKSEGVSPLKIDFKIPLLIVDSGQEAKTAKTVTFIRERMKKDPGFVESVLKTLNSISEKALNSLEVKNLESLGALMTQYYQVLRKLDISTEKLDEIIKIALKNKALGAKPTGGWGGGCCLVLVKDEKEVNDLRESFQKNGFNSFSAKIGVKGVKII